uniref:Mediator of RNA polymerase II transcription subunit 9 n=1 Tax=Plectus sambesii TaxID=2011161 RepID=A0A914UYW7_9BILA
MTRDEENEQLTGAVAKKESEALSVALHALLSSIDKNRLQEVGQRVGDLNHRLDALRKAVRAIPGIDLSEHEQSERILS